MYHDNYGEDQDYSEIREIEREAQRRLSIEDGRRYRDDDDEAQYQAELRAGC